MNTQAVEKLFKHKKGCHLCGFNGDRFVTIATGSFAEMLEFYYLTADWKLFFVSVPGGGMYPIDFR